MVRVLPELPTNDAVQPLVETFFHEATYTATHVVADPNTGSCAIIDPVLDFDARNGRTATTSADSIVAFVERSRFQTAWVLETHVHADHLTAAQYLRDRLGGRIGIGAGILKVHSIFAPLFGLSEPCARDHGFDVLFEDGDEFRLGGLSLQVLHTPGHTPACVSYAFGRSIFVGDTIFMPDIGTARADFQGGDATTLFRSIQRILSFPPDATIYLCHDYLTTERRTFAWKTSVAEQRERNVMIGGGTDEATFVKRRTERDRTLPPPQLMPLAVQVNIRAGKLPPAEGNGIAYLKLPVNVL